MSFSKQTLEHFSNAINGIITKSQEDNDLTELLNMLNSLIDIGERFSKLDKAVEFYWNEIISDAISILFSGISGQYRLAIAGLRNLLELACSAFFYSDHKIELKLFVSENFKADTYVSSLINDFHFFKTPYIKVFFADIEKIQTQNDSVSAYLNTTYAKLCDVVHGRYKALTKKDKLTIEYSKELFKKFEKNYTCTLSAVATMYVLRFNDFSNKDINGLARKSNTINF